MFSFFSKKTVLESFCEKLKVETAASQFEDNETVDGLRKALTILLLYSGYHFWQSIKESAELKKFTKDANANIVVFETLVYVWHHVITEINAFLEEAGLEEDDPIVEAVIDSLHISISFLEKYWPDFSAQEILKTRLYLQNPVKAMEKFNFLVLSSYKNNLPAYPGQGGREINTDLLMQMPLLLHIGLFSKSFLPGITESTRRMAETIFGSRE